MIGPRVLSGCARRSLHPTRMKFINALMTILGWIVAIAALLSMLGLGSVHMHFGPLDLRFPFHLRW
jgi:hypothetical protein